MAKDGNVGGVDLDADLSGLGFHVLPGVGLAGELGAAVGCIASLSHSDQSVSKLDGETKPNGAKTDVTVEDAVVTRFLLSAGVTF
jgi:hypothetical protein